eukprot:CCRYP_009025-RA/>CCRYP_009025-RA protein AED:0.13 eAED:0.15 QI:0/0/0/1/1/1/2/0/596
MALHLTTDKAAAAMVSMGRRSVARSGSTWTFGNFGVQTFRGIGRCTGQLGPLICQERHCYIPSRSSRYVVRTMASHAADTGSSSLSSVNEDEHFDLNKSTDMKHSSNLSSSPVQVSMDELLALASCHPTPLSLADMYRYGSRPSTSSKDSEKDRDQFVDVVRLRNAQFLHRELPIRIAQRAIDLLTLPHGLNRTREVQSVANTYLQYLQSLRDMPVPTNAKTEREFTNALKNFILDRHSIPMAIARGLKSLKDERKAPVDGRRLAEMEEALNRFFTARVGLRFLVEHHVLSGNDKNSDALYKQQLELEGGLELLEDETYASETWENSGSCGCIQQNCDPIKEVKRTVARVTKLCRESYGIAPEINIVDCTTDKDAKMSFTYVPHHLRYIYLSGGTSQKEDHTKHHNDPDGGIHDSPTLPPIKVVVTKGSEDVTIKIADQGGGMPRSVSKHIWSFSHSTLSKEVRSREENYEFGKDDFTGGHIRGFGLPLARIYARYFGGEVTIKSMEGYGVDAYLYLPVLGVACENLPQRVVRSPGNLDSSLMDSKQICDGDGYYNGEVSDEYWTDGSSRNDDFFQDSAITRRSSVVLSNLNDRAL